MTLKEYFKLNISTFNYCLKICGVIFTSIAAIISIAVTLKENSTDNPLIVFVACVVFGNLFGLFIATLGFLSGFGEAKKIFRISSFIPPDMKDSLSLKLRAVNEDYRFNFLNFKIIADDYSFLLIDYHRQNDEVWLNLFLNIRDPEEFSERMREFNKAYRKQSIQLTVDGLVKSIKYKELDHTTITKSIQELVDTAEKENFEIRKNQSQQLRNVGDKT